MLLRRTNNVNKIYEVQTMQTEFARFCQKSSWYEIGLPKKFGEMDAPGQLT